MNGSSSTVDNASRPARAVNAKVASLPAGGAAIDPAKEWRTYGHDPGALRFSPLKQITPENVSQLKVAWVYHMRPPGFTGGGGRGPAVMEGRGQVERSAMNRRFRPADAAGFNSAPASGRAKSRRSSFAE